ncbi:L,D-transpeptidase family protein, partial [Rubrivirga sp.]|uniref:L,D-transpeptidase family protein n=1 Tax=Rubrivirga sp. TaxID=1885344 RepID=UPI003C70DAFB
ARSAGTAPADTTIGWRLVQAGTARGYVRDEALSNIWIRVDKSERMTFVYRGAELLRTLPSDVSISPEDKVRRSDLGETDHYRVPEGTFFVTRLNPNSEYYRAFVLSYPGPVHAARGLEAGIIGQREYDAIVRADLEGLEPPMGTRMGGLIEIHGQGSGRQTAWTRGCIALRNVHMDELWEYVEVGTPVVIEP